MDRNAIPVVILAGGESRRIGGGKPLRLLGGRRLLDHALAAARSWSDDVAISVRAAGQVRDAAVERLIDDPAIEGPLGGLAAAFEYARTRARPALLTIGCDLPFLPPDLAAALGASLAEDVLVAVASSGGRLHPVCALWRIEAAAALPDYVGTGRRSLHGFAEHVGFTAVAWPSEPADPFFNINTQDDLRVAEARLSG